MAVISGVHALWPPRAKPLNKGARLVWPCNDYDFKAEARRGLVVLVGCYQSKTMYNNNQVRGLCKFIGMLQTPTTLSDYKRNIYELEDIKKQAENWFTIAFFSSCPGADYAVVKLRDERTSRCDFSFCSKHSAGWSLRLHPHTIPAFFIFQQIRLLGHSVKADSQWESITRHHLKSPWRPVALWCEQRCLVTHLKRAAIRRCWATLWPTPRLQWPRWLRLFSIVSASLSGAWASKSILVL